MVSTNNVGAAPVLRPKNRPKPAGAGIPTGCIGGTGSPVASLSSSIPVLRVRLNATTTSGDSRLIIVDLHVASVRRPLQSILTSGETHNFFRESCLSMLRPVIQVRQGPGQVVVKLADGIRYRVARREVSLPYTFDGFRSDDAFLVIEMNYAVDCILGMP